MKTLIPYRLQKFSTFIILGAVLLVAYQTIPKLFKASSVESATNYVNVLGYAWANTPKSSGPPTTGTDQGLGWISMNGTADDGSPYGVKIDLNTGYFSGNAWIGNGITASPPLEVPLVVGARSTGYVDFAPTGPYPGAPLHGVRKEGNILTGWAKVLTMNQEYSKNGWIKFSKDASDGGSDYGVTVDANGAFSGYAWGSDVIGWVDFAPAIAGVNRVHISVTPCTTSSDVNNSGGSWGAWSDLTVCSSVPAGTTIQESRIGYCGAGYSSDPVNEVRNTTKTCGSSCVTNSNCGGGEECLLGTLKCGSPTTGCGNNTCDVGENITSCPQDCKGTFQQF